MRQSLNWLGICFHHTWSKDNPTAIDWDNIKRYHMSWKFKGNILTRGEALRLIKDGVKGVQRPYRDISYNAGIELINNKISIMNGRSLEIPGAHTIGQNKKLIGIAVIGNFDVDIPTDKHYDAAAEICINYFYKMPWISINKLYGHRDFANKSCPGKNFDLLEIEKRIKERLSSSKGFLNVNR